MKNNTIKVIAGFVSGAGILVVIGWVSDISIFKSIGPSFITIKFITALSFLLSGILLYLLAKTENKKSETVEIALPLVASFILMFIGILFFSWLLGINSGFENIFVHEAAGAVKTTKPNALSIPTIFAFLLIALSGFAGFFSERHKKNLFKTVGYIVATIGGVAVFGYILNNPLVYYYVPNINTGMALYTAILFMLVGIGFLLLRVQIQENSESLPSESLVSKTKIPIIIFMVATLLITIGSLFIYKNTTTTTTTSTIKVGRYYWPGYYWVEIADKKGWFTEAGLDTQLVDISSDFFAGEKDMVDGNIDAGHFTLFDLLKYRQEGADLIAVINEDSTNGAEGIVAHKPIRSITDLKGKRIAVSKNTYMDYILTVVLDRQNINREDVVRVDMPTEKIADAFLAGTVDAAIIWEPDVTRALTAIGSVKLFDTSEISGLSPNPLVFHQSFIDAHPKEVQAFVSVWNKTTEFIKNNPQESYQIISDIYQKPVSEVEAFMKQDEVFDLRDNITSFSYGSGFDSIHGAARKINDFMKAQDSSTKTLDSADFIDSSFVLNLK